MNKSVGKNPSVTPVHHRMVPCPPEPIFQFGKTLRGKLRIADNQNGDATSKRNRSSSGQLSRKSPGQHSIKRAHWIYLYELKARVSSCNCSCEGNVFECQKVDARKYRNLRHYIFEAFKPYVEKVASISHAKRSNHIQGCERMVSRDDAISSALQVMLRRIDMYDCDNKRGASFTTYIYKGVTHAIIDEMRCLSDFPNTVAPRKRAVTNAKAIAMLAANDAVTDEEMLEYARKNYNETDYLKLIEAYGDTLTHLTTSNQYIGGNGSGEDLHDSVESACCGSELTLAYKRDSNKSGSAFNSYLHRISDCRVRDVITLCYCSDLNASLIATVLHISESMVSKLKKQGEDEIKKSILLDRKSDRMQ